MNDALLFPHPQSAPAQRSRVHYRNFDAIRLFAAAGVVFSHAFLIGTGSESTEPVIGTGIGVGVYSVFVFFILSGFLVTESAKQSATLGDFVRKRFLRIMPALVVSTLVIAYIVCPLFATNGPLAFVSNPEVFDTVLQIISLHSINFYFTDVAFYPRLSETDWLPGSANGVLWTIRLEIIGYMFIGLMAAASLFNPRRWLPMLMLVIVTSAAALIYVYRLSTPWISQLLYIVPALCCGIVMNWLVQYHKPRGWIALLLVAGIAPAVHYEVLPLAFSFLIAYPVIWLGSLRWSLLPRFYEGTDISYGVYLYGWPVTQVVRGFVGPDLSGYEMTLYALPITMLVAWLSWRFIEKPALRFKNGLPSIRLRGKWQAS
jgi:peptidoglycan/LPS O-acetylase OafA/YrhL